MRIIHDLKLDYDDVLICPQSSSGTSRKDVVITRTFTKFPHADNILSDVVPIMASNMDTIGTFEMQRSLAQHRCITCLHKHYDITKLLGHYNIDFALTFFSFGMKEKDLRNIEMLYNYCINYTDHIPNICLDVANGYTDKFVSFASKARETAPKSIIMAGNIATPQMVERLIREGGVDICKVGIGPGSACTTRIVTGIGYPQLSALIECADAAHGTSRGYICADGGCKTPGDVCKSFCAGADFVMLGGMFAGTDECNGEWEFNDDGSKKYFTFYGMSSYEAQDKYNGKSDYRPSEGRCVEIPYKGPVSKVIQQIAGGIRSCCTYIGASEIKHMSRCATFIRVNNTHNRMYENFNKPSSS